jgi:hypothetical protein
LVEVHRALRDLGDGRPRLILGGRVFGAHPEFREHFAGAEVVASARELVSALA